MWIDRQLTFRSALLSMRLHCYMCIEMVQCAIGLLTSLPSTLVHALNLLISATWTLVLLSTRDGDEGIHLRKFWSALCREVGIIVPTACSATTKEANRKFDSPDLGDHLL